MAIRSSNRERIERRALEASIEAKEKEAKAPSPKTPSRPRRAAAPPPRVKLVWKVFNDAFKEMACFPYPQEAQAKEKAAQLTKKTGKPHFVNSAKVPME